MRLRIENCNDERFVDFLIKYLQNLIRSSVSPRKLIRIDEYISSIPSYNVKFRNKITCREVILAGTYNLTYRKYRNMFEIVIDENQRIYGTKIKLSDACKLINYGTMSINGYPIFTDSFKNVEENMQDLYDRFSLGVMLGVN